MLLKAISTAKPLKTTVNDTNVSDEIQDSIVNFNLGILFIEFINSELYFENHDKRLNLVFPEEETGNTYRNQLFALCKRFDEFNEEAESTAILAVSHILFLLEKYSEYSAEISNLKKRLA